MSTKYDCKTCNKGPIYCHCDMRKINWLEFIPEGVKLLNTTHKEHLLERILEVNPDYKPIKFCSKKQEECPFCKVKCGSPYCPYTTKEKK